MSLPMRPSPGWRLRVPATAANLGPGFDCFGLALQRYLNLTVVPNGEPGSWEISLSGDGADVLARDKTNLIYRSLLIGAGMERAGIRQKGIVPGVVAHMANEIPIARGQGSSAAAIVAGMAVGQLLVHGEVDRDTLIDQATLMEGHPDNVASAVMGGLVLTREAAGGDVRARVIPTSEGAIFVLAVPEFELPTHTSRAVLPREVPFGDAVFNLRAAAWLAAAWAAGDWAGVAEAMDDRVHQPYRASLIPGFYEVCVAAREAGALAACLSGSGPTILALTLSNADDVARAMERAWRQHGITSRADVTLVDTEGLLIVPNAD